MSWYNLLYNFCSFQFCALLYLRIKPASLVKLLVYWMCLDQKTIMLSPVCFSEGLLLLLVHFQVHLAVIEKEERPEVHADYKSIPQFERLRHHRFAPNEQVGPLCNRENLSGVKESTSRPSQLQKKSTSFAEANRTHACSDCLTLTELT